jgi:hypothetical protein
MQRGGRSKISEELSFNAVYTIKDTKTVPDVQDSEHHALHNHRGAKHLHKKKRSRCLFLKYSSCLNIKRTSYSVAVLTPSFHHLTAKRKRKRNYLQELNCEIRGVGIKRKEEVLF